LGNRVGTKMQPADAYSPAAELC